MQAKNDRSINLGQRLYKTVRANIWLIAAFLVATIVALWIQWPNISDPYAVQDDFRKFYWMHRYADPGLYPDEGQILPTVRHIDLGFIALDVDIASPLYNLIFYLASPFLSINLTSKLLIFPLILLSVYLLYKIGARDGKPGTGFALATIFTILNLTSPDTISVASGLQRAFAMPMTLAVVYCLMIGRYWLAAIALAIGGLIYPPTLLLGLLVYLPSLFSLKIRPLRFKIYWRRAYPLLALAGLASVVLLPAISRQIIRIDLDSIFRFDGLQRLLNNPSYQPDSRYPLFDPLFPILVGRAGFFTRVELWWWAVVLALLSSTFVLLKPSSWRAFPGPLKHLLGAGFIGYALGWFGVVLTGSFILYLPNRYSRVGIFLALLAFVVMSAEEAIPSALNRLKQLDRRTAWLPVLVTAGTCLVLLWFIQGDILVRLSSTKVVEMTWNVVLAAGIFAGALTIRALDRLMPDDRRRPSEDVQIKGWQWALIGVLALISSWPYISQTQGKDLYVTIDESSKNVMAFLETVPVESRIMGQPCAMDSVAFLTKRSVLWSCKQPVAPLDVRNDSIAAYNGDSLIEVFQFCQRHDVDYMVVDTNSFPEGAQPALLDVPNDLKVYESGDQFVMLCRPPTGVGNIPPTLAGMEAANLAWVEIDPADVQQGSNTNLYLYWENLEPGVATPQLCLSLISQAGEATKPDCMPLASTGAIRTLGGETFAFMSYELAVSPYLNRGTYQVVAEVLNSHGGAGEPVAGVIGEINLNARPRAFASQEDQADINPIASWDEQIALLNAEISNTEGQPLTIGLSWQALARMTGSNKVFVHLVGTNGAGLVAQVDTVPQNWTYPTNWWEAGEIVSDTLTIPLDGIGPGNYQVWLGLYDEETSARLPLDGSAPANDPAYQNAVKLAEIELPA